MSTNTSFAGLEVGNHSSRLRRAHTKSRRGCRNCKLRRVKPRPLRSSLAFGLVYFKVEAEYNNSQCDEAHPCCQKCQSYGVTCNYDSSHAEQLQLEQRKTSKTPLESSFGHVIFDSIPLSPCLIVGNGYGSFRLDKDGLACLDRFQHRTVDSFGTTSSRELYRTDVVRLAVQHPFLMHIILAITSMHDSYLSTSLRREKVIPEAYHSAHAAALLSKKLSAPIMPEDRDALWASAAMLGLASVTSLDASTPSEAWPLKPFDAGDLDWMNMSKGKMAIWKATNPLRSDSIFHPMATDFRAMTQPPKYCSIDEIPQEFVKLCGLDISVDLSQNNYYTALSTLVRFWDFEYKQDLLPAYLAFLSFMEPTFRTLLLLKDPRALLIYLYWLSPLCNSVWWAMRRARLECQATCLYLETYHGGDEDIQRMLQQPKVQCGLMVITDMSTRQT
ncbi:hypothetical protein N7495_002532 [Penicillium taxi]|uniref:uncharacterized protein n=1 Tax=Penicillium taxi TaxID=168475 RepID=UPI002545A770|nr:uncharacterized protein N7495_002532 [Penicillium taxi]KAJ5902004.1 hypothetical protein N7495_002532 [Penicillium taxi]